MEPFEFFKYSITCIDSDDCSLEITKQSDDDDYVEFRYINKNVNSDSYVNISHNNIKNIISFLNILINNK